MLYGILDDDLIKHVVTALPNTHHGNKLGQLELQLDSDHLKNINVTSTTKYFKLQL